MEDGSPKPAVPGVVPTIQSPDCTKQIAWIMNVFKAQQEEIFHSQEKTVMHCSLIINGGYIYLFDSSTSLERKALGEEADRDSESRGVVLHIELEDPQPFWKNALNNGGTVVEDLKQQYWGTLYGSIRDPFGFVWGFMKGGDCRKPGVIPYLILEAGQCESYMEWLVKACDGKVKDKFESPDKNLIQHCTVEINGGVVYMADDVKMAAQKAETEAELGEGPISLNSRVICHLDLPDPQESWEKMLQNDSKAVVDLKVQFWGDLYGTLRDSTGYMWSMTKATPKDPPSSSASADKQGGVIPYIISPDCDKHIKWIEQVLGGEVKNTIRSDANEIFHCNMCVNGGLLMMACRDKDTTNKPAGEVSSSTGAEQQQEQTGLILHQVVPDPDQIWSKAMGNGGVVLVDLKQQSWGDYYGVFQDPFGYQWSVTKKV